MAYYDRFVRDPESALREIASRRDLSPEEFEQRLDNISAEAVSGRHLTLGQVKAFGADPKSTDRDAASHLNACIYCQRMVDALSADQINENLKTISKKISTVAPANPRQEFGDFAPAGMTVARMISAGSPSRRSVLPLTVMLAFIAVSCLAGFLGVHNYKTKSQVASLQTQVKNLDAENAFLALQVASVKHPFPETSNVLLGKEDLAANKLDSKIAALAGMKFTMPSDPVKWYAWDGKYLYRPACSTQPSSDSRQSGQSTSTDTAKCEMVVAAAIPGIGKPDMSAAGTR
jgi:hypothetical protein